ncbi:3367_t:CDS:2, partial [Dentiscutata erythropus]
FFPRAIDQLTLAKQSLDRNQGFCGTYANDSGKLHDKDNQEKDEKNEFYIEDDDSAISIQALTIYLPTTNENANEEKDKSYIKYYGDSTMSIQVLTNVSFTQAFIDVSIQNDNLKFVEKNEPESVEQIKY